MKLVVCSHNLETVNHERFRTASKLCWQAYSSLRDMGMSEEEAKEWMAAWTGQYTSQEP